MGVVVFCLFGCFASVGFIFGVCKVGFGLGWRVGFSLGFILGVFVFWWFVLVGGFT